VYPESQGEERAIAQFRPGIPKRLLVSICCALLSSFAQAPPEVRIRSGPWFRPGVVISTDANLVELAATVRDQKGHTVGGLHATHFELLDNNQPREITFFQEQRAKVSATVAPGAALAKPADSVSAPETPSEARSIALFFDDAHASMLGVRKSAEAAQRLIANALVPTDLVGIFTSSGTGMVDFATDRKVLLAALARLEGHPLSGVHATVPCLTIDGAEAFIITQHSDIAIEEAAVDQLVGCNCPDPTMIAACTLQARAMLPSMAQNIWDQYKYQSTTTLDLLLILIRHLAAAPGDRMLILMSPGFPTGGMEDRTSAITDAALRSNIRISALTSEGLETNRKAARKQFLLSGFMADAAKATGGKYLHDTNDWTGSLRAFVAGPEVSYLLGFSPPGEPDGKLHSLKTLVHGNHGYRVESRTGYFASPPPGKHETTQQRIDRIAMSSEDFKDFPVTLELHQERAALQAKISVEASGLQFPEKEGRHVQELTFLTVLEDAEGNFVAGKQSVMDLLLTSESLTDILQKGIRAAISFPVPRPGSYRVREVVREVVQNRIWASVVPIEVR
jgi:VWFA-related protein